MLVDEHKPLFAFRHDIEIQDLAKDSSACGLSLVAGVVSVSVPSSNGKVLCSQPWAIVRLARRAAAVPGSPGGIERVWNRPIRASATALEEIAANLFLMQESNLPFGGVNIHIHKLRTNRQGDDGHGALSQGDDVSIALTQVLRQWLWK